MLKFSAYFLIFMIFASMLSYDTRYSSLRFHQTIDTLNTIKAIISRKEKGAFLRFGDGDVNLAMGQRELLQAAHPSLAAEMREAFSMSGPTILKTLPLTCKELGGWEPGMFPGNHECPLNWCLEILHKSHQFWGGPITDVYSLVALHFAATNYPIKCLEFLKFLKHSNCVLLVGNECIPSAVREALFGSNCTFIPTPSSNSYAHIGRIERDCLEKISQDTTYKVIVTAMGCSGRVLQKRLWKKNDQVFLFDFGSLMDALCGWKTRAWIELNTINKDLFLKELAAA